MSTSSFLRTASVIVNNAVPDGSHLPIFAYATVVWTVLQMASHLHFQNKRAISTKAKTTEWANEVVSFLHGIVSITLSGFVVLTSEGLVLGQPTTPLQRATFAVSLGYVLVDTVYLLLTRLMDPTVAFHHVATTMGLIYGVFVPVSGAEMVVAMATLEITNPCLHIRWMMRALDMKTSTAYKVNELVFFGMFVLARVVFAVPFTYDVVVSSAVHPFVKVSASMLQLLSLVWAAFMAKIFFIKYLTNANKKGQ
eukprot:TRINITY_DN36725_c0_g1_i1.p1 TRINITY_DN36725_c0_g1~~TRINITY_DN36725_c0_g1_i1.p1  ORF type:complete len:252 (-),score=60.02 TRINITY_DN36725_c0_g1_i1:139-894(-)